MTDLGPKRRAPTLLLAVRPHQWAKNLLLLLPALAAHLPWTAGLGARLAVGFVAFSLAASALYVVNDLVDLPQDRLHPTKRHRAVASGAVRPAAAAVLAVALAVGAVLLALALPRGFGVAVAAYAVLSAAYSLNLKRRPVLDVIVLATLYTVRVVAGAALVAVPLSRWFLAFSILLFLSLALVKRVVELQAMPQAESGFVGGRSYVRGDIPALSALGAACTAASALVYCLYVTADDVHRLYTRPDLLWLGLPMLLYWQARVWLITGRGDMHEDPVVFALRDRVSYLLLAGFLLTVLVAA